MNTFANVLRFAVAILLIGFGVTLMVGGLMSMFPDNAPPRVSIGDIALFGGFGVLPCVVGIMLWRRAVKVKRYLADREQEHQIIHLAQRMGRKLTVSDVVLHTSLSAEQAEQTLRDMVVKGWAKLEISDSGVPVYYFHTLISQDEKHGAAGI
ncbi:MAG: hypothetical protein RML40_05750 [Bacteroidota bacterium]|nr:hypothetical protein [Candidatus Kapabacteria bacterium]MDW8220017.1 hypothetical protein [Bacteroidota bacterium]